MNGADPMNVIRNSSGPTSSVPREPVRSARKAGRRVDALERQPFLPASHRDTPEERGLDFVRTRWFSRRRHTRVYPPRTRPEPPSTTVSTSLLGGAFWVRCLHSRPAPDCPLGHHPTGRRRRARRARSVRIGGPLWRGRDHRIWRAGTSVELRSDRRSASGSPRQLRHSVRRRMSDLGAVNRCVRSCADRVNDPVAD